MATLEDLTGVRFQVVSLFSNPQDGYEQKGRFRTEDGSKVSFVKKGLSLELWTEYEIVEYSVRNSKGTVELKQVREVQSNV